MIMCNLLVKRQDHNNWILLNCFTSTEFGWDIGSSCVTGRVRSSSERMADSAIDIGRSSRRIGGHHTYFRFFCPAKTDVKFDDFLAFDGSARDPMVPRIGGLARGVRHARADVRTAAVQRRLSAVSRELSASDVHRDAPSNCSWSGEREDASRLWRARRWWQPADGHARWG